MSLPEGHMPSGTPHWLGWLFSHQWRLAMTTFIVIFGLLFGWSFGITGDGFAMESDRKEDLRQIKKEITQINQRMEKTEKFAERTLELSLIVSIKDLVRIQCNTTNPVDKAALEANIDRQMAEYRALTGIHFPRPPCGDTE